jgi:cytochrome c-type biogenesis protein CcmH/NrfG
LKGNPMKWQLFTGTVLIFFSTFLLSQVPISPIDNQETRSDAGQKPVTLTGKVSFEDGSTLGDRVSVVLQCGSDERARASTDREGNFVINLSVTGAPFDTNTSTGVEGKITPSVPELNWGQCELYGDAPGYASERLRMAGTQDVGVVQVGTLMMHPLAKSVGGFLVSVTSLQAPDKAKKNFEKGQEQEKKRKWAAARDYFLKAVEAYPRYALAWLELGRTQLKQNDFTQAQQSFYQATAQDPHLLEAYIQIATLAAHKQQWKELADATDHIVQLSPDSSPSFWFLNSAAHLNLGNISRAESSATRGLRLDGNHKVAQLEYLYGMILARRGDYKAAIPHLETYLRLSPNATDAQDAQTRLAEVRKLAAPSNEGSH